MQNVHKPPYEGGIIIHVTGRVQGVGFRFFTYQQAKKWQLVGYVKNLSNGDVEILAYGTKTQLDSLINWLEKGGPSSAKITHFDVKQANFEQMYTTFNVRY